MNNNAQMLSVSSPPFWHCGQTITTHMRDILIALIPVAVFAVITWGLPALRVMALSIFVCVITEAVAQRMMNRQVVIDNWSAVLTGLLFAFLMPADSVYWVVALGAFLSIVFGKLLFGDLGSSPVCAPVVGYLLCSLSFPTYTDANMVQLATFYVDPLVQLKAFGADAASDLSYFSLLFGKQISGLGTGQGFFLIAGGVYLCYRGLIPWEISLSFILGIFFTSLIFFMADSSTYASPFFHLFTGSTLLGAFFLSTDMSSSPNKQINMLIYGAVAGIMVILIRVFGVYTDGVPFAILLCNMIAMPLLEGRKQKPLTLN